MTESFSDKILAALAQFPGLTDRELTDRLKGRGDHPSHVNQECRLLERRGVLRRSQRPDGIIGNYLKGAIASETPPASPPKKEPSEASALSEDDVKRHLVTWLEAEGWSTEVAWGKTRGVDIRAERGAETWLIEVKGAGSLQPMRVNYFLAILGETLQRMDDATARYSIALPDMPQFRGLWQRLPALAKTRTGITALFVTHASSIIHDADTPKHDQPTERSK
jgi:hypothetical protein